MKKLCAVLLCMSLLFSAVFALAEGSDVLTINLHEASDEELQNALSLIKAEQRSRLSTKVVLEPAEITVGKNATVKIDASVSDLPEGVTAGDFTWKISDESIATFAKGSVKGGNAGETIITCSSTLSDGTEVSAEAKITVVIPVQNLKAKANKMEVMASETFKPEFDFTPKDATNTAVEFESSDAAVVKVTEDGQLLATGAGKAVITAKTTDGSNKTAKVNVTVSRKVGKFDDELRFQGLEWGCDYQACEEKLKEVGIINEDARLHPYSTILQHLWPENELMFNGFNWVELPVVFRDKDLGVMQSYLSPEKKIGGYAPNSMSLYYLNGITDGKVDGEITKLCGVYISYDNDHEPGAEIFRNLLSKMEEQYGAFTKYVHKSFTRRYYKDVYDGIKDCMADAKQFTDRDIKDGWLSVGATCILHGKNNTGIMLNIGSSGNVTLYYGKTDTMEGIKELQKILEEIPDTTEDAGL